MHEGLDLLTVAQISGTSVAMIERHYGHLRGEVASVALARSTLSKQNWSRGPTNSLRVGIVNAPIAGSAYPLGVPLASKLMARASPVAGCRFANAQAA